MVCFLYVMTLGACLALAGWLVESVLPPRCARRWIWCATLALSITIPPLYRVQHRSIVGAAPGLDGDPSWWVRIGAFDAQIISVWAVVSLLLVLIAGLSVLRVSYLLRQSHQHQERSIVDGIAVAITDTLGPATVGLLRSHVVIPRWVLALPPSQRQYVLRHEEEHRNAFDTQVLFFASLVIVLTPWNLPIYWQLRRLSLAVEMDCDNRVVKALGGSETYADLLLNIAEASNHAPRLQPNFLGKGSLERRLTQLLAPGRRSRMQQIMLSALAIALLYAALAMPHPLTPDKLQTHSANHAATQ